MVPKAQAEAKSASGIHQRLYDRWKAWMVGYKACCSVDAPCLIAADFDLLFRARRDFFCSFSENSSFGIYFSCIVITCKWFCLWKLKRAHNSCLINNCPH